MDAVDLQVLDSAAGWLAAGRRVALVTVAATWGSSPRPVGAMAAFTDDGRIAGSVSGGCVEDDLLQRMREHFPEALSIAAYGVTAEEARRFGLPCGGTLQLVVEPLASVEPLQPALDAVRARRSIGRRLGVPGGKVAWFDPGPDAVPGFEAGVLVSVFGPRWRLILVGAGQLSRYLAEFALALDYQVSVCDPRSEYAIEWKVPGAELLQGMPDDAVREARPDARTVVVALTHDPKLDDMALMEALKSDAFYVGALGSRANSEKRRRRLAQLDLAEAQIARLHAPVGLDIGSRTPPEIALAVLAQVTALRHGRVLAPAARADEARRAAA